MKTFCMIIWVALLYCINLYAQTITGTLAHSKIFRVHDVFIVSGFDDGGVFKLISYDKNLSVKKQYSMQPGTGVNEKITEVRSTGDGVACLFRTGTMSWTGTVLKVNKDLEEVSNRVYEKKDKKEFLEVIHFFYPRPFNPMLEESEIEQLQRATYGIESVKKVPQDIEVMNAVFDSSRNRTIVAGNYFIPDKKADKRIMKGIVVLTMSNEGNVIAMNKFDFPVYPFKEPKVFSKSDDRKTDVNAIIFLKPGNIVLNCTQTSYTFISYAGGGPGGGYGKYAAMGFSYYEFNDSLEMVSSAFHPFETLDYKKAWFEGCSSDGRKILFTNEATSQYHDPDMSSQTLYFPASGAPFLKQNYAYRDESSFSQFLADDNTAIIFKPDKKSYELKVVKLD